MTKRKTNFWVHHAIAGTAIADLINKTNQSVLAGDGAGRITIDVDPFGDDFEAVLIISAPTGIFYTAQSGGMSCLHPESEGFAISLFNPVSKIIDDHEYGCSQLQVDANLRKKLADDLDKGLLIETERYGFSLRFDYDRIESLMEGWWPVVVTGKIAHINTELNHQAYLVTGNCD